jgi:16S rRNA G527 N7-methylase RsmG
MSLKPPSDLICTSEEHFRKGAQWVEYFTTVCRLRPNERVLDVGSGGGRVAIPLSQYLTD